MPGTLPRSELYDILCLDRIEEDRRRWVVVRPSQWSSWFWVLLTIQCFKRSNISIYAQPVNTLETFLMGAKFYGAMILAHRHLNLR